jgi:hypothetical protein
VMPRLGTPNVIGVEWKGDHDPLALIGGHCGHEPHVVAHSARLARATWPHTKEEVDMGELVVTEFVSLGGTRPCLGLGRLAGVSPGAPPGSGSRPA